MRFWYLLLIVLLISPAFAQTSYKVKRGERPVINLQSVPESAYYKGVIKIKLNESFTRQLDENPAFMQKALIPGGPSMHHVYSTRHKCLISFLPELKYPSIRH